MKRLLAGVVLCAALMVNAAQTQPIAPPAPHFLHGVVVDAYTGAPVRRAQVRLSAAGRADADAVSDREGRFRVVVDNPGRYTLTATKPGYWQSSFGQVRLGGADVAVDIPAPESSLPLTLTMWRGGVISGRVVDENGDPAVRVEVRLLQSRYVNGGRRLVSVSGTRADPAESLADAAAIPQSPIPGVTTDDLGAFRFYNLPSGRYYVAARSSGPYSPFQGSTGLEPRATVVTFFPNAVDLANARAIDVAAGQESAPLTISLASAPAARVRGRLLRSNGEPFTGFVDLRPHDEYGFTASVNSIVRRDGLFEIGRLAPGIYHLAARSGSIINPGAEAGSAVVTVSGSDVDDVVIVAGAAGLARGRIVTDDGSPLSEPASKFVLSASPAAAMSIGSLPSRPTISSKARITPQHSFEIAGLLGEHQLRLDVGADSDWAMKSVLWRGTDITDQPIAFAPDAVIDGITIVLTRLANEVRGVVNDGSGRPTADAWVVIFPADESLWPSDRWVRATQPDRRGQFRLRQLPELDRYLLAAIPYNALAEGDWFDPAQLRAMRALATPLSLTASEKKAIDLQVGTR